MTTVDRGVVLWNEGTATLLGRRADETMGRHRDEVLGGRDLFGNRFYNEDCHSPP
jgi:hypothetical protein